MPTPIEIMIDKACGVTGINKNDTPEVILLELADAAKAWRSIPTAENICRLEEAVEAWEVIGG